MLDWIGIKPAEAGTVVLGVLVLVVVYVVVVLSVSVAVIVFVTDTVDVVENVSVN